jgi:hypothetical protein
VHHRTIQINHQPNATIFQFIIAAFVYSSTCFGSFPDHHQEPNDCSGSLWFYLRIVVIVVLCSWSGRPSSLWSSRSDNSVWRLICTNDVSLRPGSHVSHFIGRARSGIVFAVGKTQVYWPHTHLSASSLRWRTFSCSPQIPPAPQRFWLYRSISLDVWTQTDANSRTHVNECGTVTCVTAASSNEEMTDVWTGPSGGYTPATLPRIVTPYRNSVDETRARVTYQKFVTR